MRILFLFVALIISLNAEVVSKTTTKTANAKGFGASYQEALDSALINAIGKLNGIKMQSNTLVSTDLKKTNNKSELNKLYNEQISKKTGGRFDSYEVLREKKSQNGYEVEVLIKKSKTTKSYKTPGLDPNSRRKIAVMPGYSKHAYVYIDGKQVFSQYVADDITRRLVSALSATRKFSVLDREADHAYNSEAALISSEAAAKDEALKLGGVLGADYILVFSLDSFEVSKSKSANITASSGTKKELNATVYYRVIAFSTRQVKYSNQATIKLKAKDAYESGIQAIAQRISDDIVSAIYPLKVASLNAGELVITQPLKVGEIYDIYATSKQKIKDPYTGELVAAAETKVGEASVVRSDNKLSYLKITSGTGGVGDILRLKGGFGAINDSGGKEGSDVKQIQGGGVVLPF